MNSVDNRLFRQMSWSEFGQTSFDDAVNQQIIYITDKNLRVKIKQVDDEHKIKLITSGQYSFSYDTNTTLNNLKRIENELAAGIYIITAAPTTQGASTTASMYYFTGRPNEWLSISGGGDSGYFGNLNVNDIKPDAEGNIRLSAADIYFSDDDDKTESIQTKIENIQTNMLQLDSEHQWYDGKAPDGAVSDERTLFREGNLHITGYYEGKVDGGGW